MCIRDSVGTVKAGQTVISGTARQQIIAHAAVQRVVAKPGIYPVSYTHLDVYKRQVIARVALQTVVAQFAIKCVVVVAPQ